MVMAMIMGMRVGVIMVVLVRVIMTLCTHGGPYAVVVMMNITLMVVVVVDDQSAGCTLIMGMFVMVVIMVAVLMVMIMVMFMIMFVMMLMIVLMAGDPRLAASAYATHINLPRCR
ncbi:hypothetical protein [Aeromonas allosaccharophila]|uniref:hypothetical protein n=1 Tax=Aeromonas allosaccharophila TaxID=656 RepID=UPI003F4CC8F3